MGENSVVCYLVPLAYANVLYSMVGRHFRVGTPEIFVSNKVLE